MGKDTIHSPMPLYLTLLRHTRSLYPGSYLTSDAVVTYCLRARCRLIRGIMYSTYSRSKPEAMAREARFWQGIVASPAQRSWVTSPKTSADVTIPSDPSVSLFALTLMESRSSLIICG